MARTGLLISEAETEALPDKSLRLGLARHTRAELCASNSMNRDC